MSDKSNNQGRGFEYACLESLYSEIGKKREVKINQNSSYYAAKKAWDLLDLPLQNSLLKSSYAFVDKVFDLEPLILDESGDVIVLSIQEDSNGEKGDVRDIILIRKSIDWEIGFSIKHNHAAVKHSRLATSLDFGKKWYGRKCSDTYWAEVSPIFSYLESERNKGTCWRDLPDKNGDVYIPLLNSFIDEIKRSYEFDNQIPRKMAEYLLGEYDYYKVISLDSKRITEIQAYNHRGHLNKDNGQIKPKIQVPVVELPNKILDLSFKSGSSNTVIMSMNGGWKFSFRIHNASTIVEPSLKFDVQLDECPKMFTTIDCKWV